jgi:hypothetical protein
VFFPWRHGRAAWSHLAGKEGDLLRAASAGPCQGARHQCLAGPGVAVEEHPPRRAPSQPRKCRRIQQREDDLHPQGGGGRPTHERGHSAAVVPGERMQEAGQCGLKRTW